MKIVFLVHSLRKGGAERLVLELASCKEAFNAEIEVISWLDTNEYLEDKYKDVKFTSILKTKEYRWLFSLKSSSSILRTMLNSISPDVVFIFSHSVLWLSLLARYKSVYVNVIQGFNQISKFRKVKKLFYRPIDIISSRLLNLYFITPTLELANEVSKYFCIALSRITIISNGIEVKIDDSKPTRNEHPNICMLGTLGYQKGQHLAIEAMVQLVKKDPLITLNIIGDGELKITLEEKISNLGLKNNVFLLGRVEDPFLFMQKADIFWHLSMTEGMPLAVIEAMALGLPIVGFDVEGVREVVTDEHNGYLLEYGDVNGIVEKSNFLFGHEIYRRNMSELSQKIYSSKYTKSTMITSYKKFIANIENSLKS